MKKNGQIGVNVLLYIFIAVLVGVVVFQAAAQQVGTATNTVSVVNQTFATPANLTAGYITDYRLVSGLTVVNASNGAAVASGNYTVANNQVYNGALAVSITPDASTNVAAVDWNLTYTGQPLTYIDDSGGRAIAGLILILFALAILMIPLYPVINSKILE